MNYLCMVCSVVLYTISYMRIFLNVNALKQKTFLSKCCAFMAALIYLLGVHVPTYKISAY